MQNSNVIWSNLKCVTLDIIALALKCGHAITPLVPFTHLSGDLCLFSACRQVGWNRSKDRTMIGVLSSR